MKTITKHQLMCALLMFITYFSIVPDALGQLDPNKYCTVGTEVIDQQTKEVIKSFEKRYRKSISSTNGTAKSFQEYDIPIVVHVLHNGQAVGDSKNPGAGIISSVLNSATDHFRHRQANARTYSNPNYGIDTEINLGLVSVDPDGNATSGIQRYQITETSGTTSDWAALVQSYAWDMDKYCNLFIIPEMTNAAGVYWYQYRTSNGVIERIRDYTIYNSGSWNAGLIAHEIGHYFTLRHTFDGCENDNCLEDGDMVCDTPPKGISGGNGASWSDCIPNDHCGNTDEDDTHSRNPYRAVALGGLGNQPDMISNYMDYTGPCWDAFTLGQKARMHANIENERQELVSQISTCSDGIQNGDETGIDCGGSECEECPCEHPDYAGLMALYNSTDGDNWTNNDGWGENCEPCGWFGITCLDDRVLGINLPRNGLAGSIPPDIQELKHLKGLILAGSAINNIPIEITEIDLIRLNLLGASISEIPVELGNISTLRHLSLRGNLISVIPKELGNLSSLIDLDLSGNLISDLPMELGNLNNLQSLLLSNNEIMKLPKEISNLRNLQNLDLRENSITGLPEELGNLSALKDLQLQENAIQCYPPTLTSFCSRVNVVVLGNQGLPSFTDFCATGAGTCTDEPTCSDGFQNGDETGIDCGGEDCAPCCPDITLINFSCTNAYNLPIDDCNRTVTVNYNHSFANAVTSSESEIVEWKYTTAPDVGDGTQVTEDVVISHSDWVSIDQDITITYPEGTSFINIHFKNDCGVETRTSDIPECTNGAIRVDVVDAVPPIVKCQTNRGFIVDPSTGQATVTVNDIDDGSYDNCTAQDQLIRKIRKVGEPDSALRDEITFGCGDVGDQGVELVISDRATSMNVDGCITGINIIDAQNPTVFCKSHTVTLDENGSASIANEDVVVSVNDNCATTFDISLSQSTFTCDDVGNVSVTITVKDPSGNQNICITTVVVMAKDNCDTCSDGMQNGNETGIDCGGSECEPCNTFTCFDNVPAPEIETIRLERRDGYAIYHIGVNNWEEIPTELFERTMELPPCGLNDNASRSWVTVYSESGSRLSGFCAFSSNSNLKSFWLAVDDSECPPEKVYIEIEDRACNVIYRSSAISVWKCFAEDAHNTGEISTSTCDECETCNDGIQNGDEEEIDCGGELCQPCILPDPPTGLKFDDEILDNGCKDDGVQLESISIPIKWLPVNGADLYNVFLIARNASDHLLNMDLEETSTSFECSDCVIDFANEVEVKVRVRVNGLWSEYSEIVRGDLEPFNTDCPELVDNDGDGYTENEGDCDDTDPEIYPGVLEYADADGDGFGNINVSREACPSDNDGGGQAFITTNIEYVLNAEDCDDTNPNISPSATEICGNDIDEDCNGIAEACDCDNPDVTALMALYNSTDGDNWTVNTGWGEGCDPCGWYGVSCNNGRVVQLEMLNNNLNGTIPSALGNLSQITSLIIFYNPNLTGSIPSSLGNLTKLDLLALESNSLSGTIPLEIYNLINLEFLSFGENNLIGSIDTRINQLTNLRILLLNQNNLNGSIPASLGDLHLLERLRLHNNDLSGPIPSSIGNASSLVELNLSNNNLSGKIPSELANLDLETLRLQINNLEGCLPQPFTKFCQLEYVGFFSNPNLQSWSDFCENGSTNCLGCTDDTAHNYDPDALESDGSCETCTDGIQNGDETGIDCGGQLCNLCETDIDNDGDGYTENEGDCDDTDPEIYPGVLEYADVDGDGYGDTNMSREACPSVASTTIQTITSTIVTYVLNDLDCDDTDASINPTAAEVCGNAIDENCDGLIEVCPNLDEDGDGYTVSEGDCDDQDAFVFPGGQEICDGKDNDCDGEIDNGLLTTYYRDRDGDSYGDDNNVIAACSRPRGYAIRGGDCNDSRYGVNPGVAEICGDGIDQDCDGSDLSCLDVDNDGDGYTENEGDCDDTTVDISPGVEEVCDGIDNNCDGLIDEGLRITYYTDWDGDGYGAEYRITWLCPGETSPYATTDRSDCDDDDATVYPGAPEICEDGKVNDCSNGDDTVCTGADNDGDGYTTDGGDCDDSNASIYPGAREICDGIDNDCDGAIDENTGINFYADLDGDGYGDADNRVRACAIRDGLVRNGDDCDDTNADVYPGAEEICGDGIANDCSGADDEACIDYDMDDDGYTEEDGDCNDLDASIYPGAPEICGDDIDSDCDGSNDPPLTTYYTDWDGDGYGARFRIVKACSQPKYCVTNRLDCDDDDATVYPGAPEICEDGKVNDCSGGEDTMCTESDNDGDGYTTDGGDCDDSNAAIYPGAREVCDGIDNDCDGAIDENTGINFYVDLDGDGYGDAGNRVRACTISDGLVRNGDDCDDTNADVYPGAEEICGDGIANDCSGADDEACIDYDMDDDGYTEEDGDCNDLDASIYPGAPEICGDDIDSDCDGSNDPPLTTYYTDWDGDGYGARHRIVKACSQPKYCVTNRLDCDDDDASVYPGAEEICGDGIDQDCNGSDLECAQATSTVTKRSLAKDTPTDASVDLAMQAYPNPTTGSVTIDFEIADSRLIEFHVIDITGSIQKVIPFTSIKGHNRYEMNINGLNSGVYFIKLMGTEDVRQPKRIIKIDY